MEGLNVYRVQIYRRTSRSGQPIEPLEKVVISEMRVNKLTLELSRRYCGFGVIVEPVEEIERVEPEAKPAPAHVPVRKDTWITGCRLSGGEVSAVLGEAIEKYGAARDALKDAEEEVKAIVREIEKAKRLVREVDLTDMRIDTSCHGSVNNIKLMLEGDYLEELQGKEDEA